MLGPIPNWFLSWPRPFKRLVAVLVDVCLCLTALWVSISLRVEHFLLPAQMPVLPMLVSLIVALPLFIHFGLYRAIFRYAGLNAFVSMAKAMAIYSAVFAGIFAVVGVSGVPRSIGVSQPLLLFLFVALSRYAVRYVLGGMYRQLLTNRNATRVVIYGAGSAGRQLAAGLQVSKDMRLMGYLDDDQRLHGQILDGVVVYGPQNLSDLVSNKKISLILLAMPTAPRHRRNEILNLLGQHHLKVRTLPPVQEMVHDRVLVSDLKELDIDDLLGRDPVTPNPLMMAKMVVGKTVMVTGAGGTIGAELCRQILSARPKKLLLLESNEYALYAVEQNLTRHILEKIRFDVEVIPLLGSVRDDARMGQILATWKPNTIYHAAAFKHVPLVEHNPAEGIRNNVFGTQTLAKQAALQGVADFVLVSTDKAVRPTNIMGASKRLAEMVLQAYAEQQAQQGGKTCFSMVRFGNVLGSSGSVVPLFRQQIHDGGPITLTHADVTRYFMTVSEAAQLVIQASAMAKGGEVFLLDMGQPVKIMDLARRMVVLSGLVVKSAENPIGDIEIRLIGLRPGEKLYEELLIGDNPMPTAHSSIMKAHEEFLPLNELDTQLQALDDALDSNDITVIRNLLINMVPGYQPAEQWVDWVWMENEKMHAM